MFQLYEIFLPLFRNEANSSSGQGQRSMELERRMCRAVALKIIVKDPQLCVRF